MNDTGGYIHKREGYILCVHCIDHILKDDLIEIKGPEVTPQMQCRKCGKSLSFVNNQGPTSNGDH